MDETIEMCRKAGAEEVYTHDLDVTDRIPSQKQSQM